jgi:hypothetical protein
MQEIIDRQEHELEQALAQWARIFGPEAVAAKLADLFPSLAFEGLHSFNETLELKPWPNGVDF